MGSDCLSVSGRVVGGRSSAMEDDRVEAAQQPLVDLEEDTLGAARCCGALELGVRSRLAEREH